MDLYEALKGLHKTIKGPLRACKCLIATRASVSNKTPSCREAFANAREPVGEPNLPVLGVYLLVGSDIQTKAYNLRRNLDEECVSLIESVAVKPSLGASST